MCLKAPKMPDPPPPPPPPPPPAERSAMSAKAEDLASPEQGKTKKKKTGTNALTISRGTGVNIPGA